jgi:molybdopterin/thiamine biosynthesis adenylyltransferase
MNQRFYSRQIKFWGEKTQNNLKNKKIAIIGCGGLGCSLGLTLGSSGIGEFHLIDFDRVEIHNIHRQLGFNIDNVGEYKSEALKKTLQKRAFDAKFFSYTDDFERFIKYCDMKFDLILDATDNLETRVKIDNFAKKKNIPWIYASVERFNGQVCFFEKSIFSSFNTSHKTPKGVTPPIVAFIASFQANLALRYLANLGVKKDTLYYLFISQNGELEIKKFTMPK